MNNYLFPKITITPKRKNKKHTFFKYQFSYNHNQLDKEIIFYNLEQAYFRAKSDDIEYGLNWYKNVNEQLKQLSNKYLIKLDKVCTIVSILSPLTYWDRNIDLAEKSINQWINGEKVKVHIFKKNDRKVEKVLNFPSFIFDIDSFMNKNTGRKTYNFTYNLSQPTNPDYVTIDSFIISLACGLSEYSFSAKINNKGYDVIKKQLTILAEKYDIVPCEMQTILWSVSHRDNNSSYQDLISLVKEHDSEMVIEKYV